MLGRTEKKEREGKQNILCKIYEYEPALGPARAGGILAQSCCQKHIRDEMALFLSVCRRLSPGVVLTTTRTTTNDYHPCLPACNMYEDVEM